MESFECLHHLIMLLESQGESQKTYATQNLDQQTLVEVLENYQEVLECAQQVLEYAQQVLECV